METGDRQLCANFVRLKIHSVQPNSSKIEKWCHFARNKAIDILFRGKCPHARVSSHGLGTRLKGLLVFAAHFKHSKKVPWPWERKMVFWTAMSHTGHHHLNLKAGLELGHVPTHFACKHLLGLPVLGCAFQRSLIFKAPLGEAGHEATAITTRAPLRAVQTVAGILIQMRQ